MRFVQNKYLRFFTRENSKRARSRGSWKCMKARMSVINRLKIICDFTVYWLSRKVIREGLYGNRFSSNPIIADKYSNVYYYLHEYFLFNVNYQKLTTRVQKLTYLYGVYWRVYFNEITFFAKVLLLMISTKDKTCYVYVNG